MGYLERQQNKNLNFQPHSPIMNTTRPARFAKAYGSAFYLRPLNLPSNPYTKAYKTPGQQVSLLQSRGLEILDHGLAQTCLERIGYYRLSGYWYPFRKSRFATHPLADQTKLADKYGLRPVLLTSFVRNLNNIRNICAHHSRLWNKSPADRISPPRLGEIATLDHLANDVNAYSRVYASVAVMQHFLTIINPSTHWTARLKAHLQTLPATNGISLAQAGFPAGWEMLPLWKHATHPQPSHESIATRAFYLWEGRGKPEGQSEVDWSRAEHELASL